MESNSNLSQVLMARFRPLPLASLCKQLCVNYGSRDVTIIQLPVLILRFQSVNLALIFTAWGASVAPQLPPRQREMFAFHSPDQLVHCSFLFLFPFYLWYYLVFDIFDITFALSQLIFYLFLLYIGSKGRELKPHSCNATLTGFPRQGFATRKCGFRF